MRCSGEIEKLVGALLKSQAAMPSVAKDGSNPHFKSKYASLPGIFTACLPVLNKNGILLVQSPGDAPKGFVALETTLMHSSGQWMSSSLLMPTGKETAQAVGSALTYARRYAFCAMLGIVADDDDDGNAATGAGDKGPKAGEAPPDDLDDLF